MVTILIPRAKPEGEGSYRSIIPILSIFYTIVIIRNTNWFPRNKEKVAQE